MASAGGLRAIHAVIARRLTEECWREVQQLELGHDAVSPPRGAEIEKYEELEKYDGDLCFSSCIEQSSCGLQQIKHVHAGQPRGRRPVRRPESMKASLHRAEVDVESGHEAVIAPARIAIDLEAESMRSTSLSHDTTPHVYPESDLEDDEYRRFLQVANVTPASPGASIVSRARNLRRLLERNA
eukprot:TRINITY_DN40246_c0_g1_i1.p1 TRINITY_DN40246_c0_g1~~TRINITY_DN40246_c0_g1_i1.p1  ORF type:complete len:184 (-),score=16.18 TRINITY_DN40246_c0_g1_i1:14-565(-)